MGGQRHDPAEIVKTMQEKVKPLLDAGKAVEAEAELDRVLEQFSARAQPPLPKRNRLRDRRTQDAARSNPFASFLPTNR